MFDTSHLPIALAAQRAKRLKQRLRQIRWIARTMDEQFNVLGTKICFGWMRSSDWYAGIGDAMTSSVSPIIIHHASRLGIPSFVLLKMIANIGIDFIFGLVPIVGGAFDFAWKANRRNARYHR